MKMKTIFTLLAMMGTLCFFANQSAFAWDDHFACEPKSPGFYKNHPEEINIHRIFKLLTGIDPNEMTTADYLNWMEDDYPTWVDWANEWLNMPVKKNKQVTMTRAFIAAVSNFNKGCHEPYNHDLHDFYGCYYAARVWMHLYGNYPGHNHELMRANSPPWQEPTIDDHHHLWIPRGEEIYECLDEFNNGVLNGGEVDT